MVLPAKAFPLVFFFLIFVLVGCEDNLSSSGDSWNQKDRNSRFSEPATKQINWGDGNIYSYHFIETITKVDSLGNQRAIQVYKSAPPDEKEVICEGKVCEWCGREVQAGSYEIEEYPDINWLRGEESLASFIGALSMIFEGRRYFDLENNRIRTEWRINCNYPGPDGYCSPKCKRDHRYSE
jgi:hypothetical protein